LEKNEKEGGRVGYFLDCGLLVFYSFLSLFFLPPGAGFLIAFLSCVSVICCGYAVRKKALQLILCILFGFLGLAVPEIFIFYPCLFYLLFHEKMRGLAAVAVLFFLWKIPESRENMGLFAMTGVFGFLLAFFMERNTAKSQILEEELRRTQDDSKERSLLLSQKNKALQEKQDYEIYNATLKERNRIAREIHDNVGHVLSRTILLTGAVKAVNKDQNLAPMLDGLDDSLNSAMDSIRSSVHDLHDEAINLQEELKRIIRDFKYCKVELKYDASDKMDSNVKYCYACVVKEALSNIMKYSGATYVKITVREHPALYQLCVEDNGRGGTENMDKNTGIGLKNMQDRVQALNGTLRIEGEKGFRIFAMIPKEMPKEKENN